MIKNFGQFKKGELSVENGFKFYPMINEKGEDFHLNIVKSESTYDGPSFLDAVLPFYAAVRPDLTVRMVSDEPSRVQPDDSEWFIGSDEEIKIGQIYDVEDNTLTDAPATNVISIVYAVDFWTRLTDEEAEQVVDFIDTQPVRLRRIFNAANSYRSDHELWGLLQGMSVAMFGEERTAEIFAPSETETV